MTKTYGARIVCENCGAEPWPDFPATTRETFDLRKIGGSWFCERHRPSKKERAPCVVATSAEALIEFERAFSTESSRFGEVFADCDDEVVVNALEEFGEEVGRALNILKKSLAEQAAPNRAEKSTQTKRARLKPIGALERDHEGQGDLIADHKAESGAAS